VSGEGIFGSASDLAEQAMNPPETRFIFDWRKARWDLRLPVLVAISLLGHVLCFYLFHVVYPPTTSLLPPSAQVTVLDPSSPRDKSMLEWIEVNDPATISAPRFDLGLVSKLASHYKPSFSSMTPELKPSDASEAPVKGIPSIFSAETLIPMRRRPAATASPKMFPSRLEIASTLHERPVVSSQALPLAWTLAEPASFFIGVNPAGEVDFLFLRSSSGSNSLDEAAESFIRKLRFKLGSHLDWGVVTLQWGGNPL
jgi:hypothetical protein